MEMRITISGAGFALGKTGFGVNALAGAYIETRPSSSFTPCLLALVKGPGIGSESGTVVFGHIQTEWFRVSTELHPWLAKRESLVGKTASIEVTGATVAGGRVDIEFDLISDEGDATSLLSKAHIRSSGFQISSTKVRGRIVQMPVGRCAAA